MRLTAESVEGIVALVVGADREDGAEPGDASAAARKAAPGQLVRAMNGRAVTSASTSTSKPTGHGGVGRWSASVVGKSGAS